MKMRMALGTIFAGDLLRPPDVVRLWDAGRRPPCCGSGISIMPGRDAAFFRGERSDRRAAQRPRLRLSNPALRIAFDLSREFARKRVSRGLTDEERTAYLGGSRTP